jgi:PRTRC genetic system ThiF family protein
MQALTLDPIVPFVARSGPITIALVGCGGNGSHIAQALARIAAHVRARRTELRIIFIDGDTVEEKNVGRQLFTPSDIGKNKAMALAARFNHLFGLEIEAVAEMATVDRLACLGGVTRRFGGKNDSLGILIGAVDNAVGRKSIAGALRDQKCWTVWLDAGNHEDSGQVVVGTETTLAPLRQAIKVGICTRLPAPSLVYPELLEATERRRRDDCAAAMEDNLQSLMVNQMMAAIAGEYLYKLVVPRRLTTFQTVVDLNTLAMRSTPITVHTLAAVAERVSTRKEQVAA